jgi:hypothetical protein
MKTIQDIRKSFRDKYNSYAKDLDELNTLIHKLALETDEILGFMETTIKLKEELPKQE